MSAIEYYEQTVKQMSSSERLRLASLILNDLVPTRAVDNSTEWNLEDLADVTRASLTRFDRESGAVDADSW